MLYLVIFILFLIIILSIFLLIKINIVLKYRLDGLDDQGEVSFKLIRRITLYKLQIPDKSKKKQELEEKKKGSIDGFWDKLNNAKEVYGLFKKLKFYLAEKIQLNELKLNIDVGTGDACYTGLASGMLWSAAGILVSYISHTFRMVKNSIEVTPNYMEKKLKVELYCIFSIKTVYIIVVLSKILLHQIKKKKSKVVE